MTLYTFDTGAAPHLPRVPQTPIHALSVRYKNGTNARVEACLSIDGVNVRFSSF